MQESIRLLMVQLPPKWDDSYLRTKLVRPPQDSRAEMFVTWKCPSVVGLRRMWKNPAVWACGCVGPFHFTKRCLVILLLWCGSLVQVFDHFGHHEGVKNLLTWLYNKRDVSLPCCIWYITTYAPSSACLVSISQGRKIESQQRSYLKVWGGQRNRSLMSKGPLQPLQI